MKIVRSHINEAFTEESDPVEDMGIGLRVVINEWIKENDTEGDVDAGYMTPAMFIVKNHNDAETVKEWIEFLLREGNEKIKIWEEDYVEDMIGAGVKFIPNSKVLPQGEFKYEKHNEQYYLYIKEWSHLSAYFNLHGDVDRDFIVDVLNGEGSKYFQYNYGNQQLTDLEDSLSKSDEQQLFDYLKPICEEHAGMELEADNISDLFDIIAEDIPEVHEALLQAYSYNVAQVEEEAAYNDIVASIKTELRIFNAEYEDNRLVLEIDEKGLNKLFAAWYLEDYGINYYPPHYGWNASFNIQYFIDDFENALE